MKTLTVCCGKEAKNRRIIADIVEVSSCYRAQKRVKYRVFGTRKKMNQKFYETKRGARLLNEAISNLKLRAAEIVPEIARARDFGDLSENAEYKEAKEMQKKISADLVKLMDYEQKLTVVDNKNVNLDRISICSTVRIQNTETGEEKNYTIVGSQEADASKGLISYTSPIARALMGKKLGELLEFKPPESKIIFNYEIKQILYEDDYAEENNSDNNINIDRTEKFQNMKIMDERV